MGAIMIVVGAILSLYGGVVSVYDSTIKAMGGLLAKGAARFVGFMLILSGIAGVLIGA